MSVEGNTIGLQAILDTVSGLPTVEDVVPDTTFLYVREDTYPYMIYIPEKGASRIITKADLAELMGGGRRVEVMLVAREHVYAQISEYGFTGAYGYARVQLKGGSLKLYTAEYAPEAPVTLYASAEDEYLYHTSDTTDAAGRVTLAELQEIEDQALPIAVEFYDGEQSVVYEDCWLRFEKTYGCIAWDTSVDTEADTDTGTDEETGTDENTDASSEETTWQFRYTSEYSVVTLYASAEDEYLYHTSDTTDAAGRVTLEELQEIKDQALPITVEFYDGEQSETQKCCGISCGETYGMMQTSTDSAVFAYYTAEYVYLTLYGNVKYEVEDGYLYLSGDNTDEANRMTKAELLELKLQGLPMLVRFTEKGESMRAYASGATSGNGYGRVNVMTKNGWRYFYTTGYTVYGWDE